MKIFLLSLLAVTAFAAGDGFAGRPGDKREKKAATANQYKTDISEIHARDPFIFLDKPGGHYYMHLNGGGRVICYQSRDLAKWRHMGSSFVPEADFWGKKDFWAPDLYEYQGNYYLFITMSAPGTKRGTTVLVSRTPAGPFRYLVNHALTPDDQMCLDGALHIDKQGKPWLLYCREWLEVIDGQVCAIRLTDNLKSTMGEPHILFHASQAPWVGEITSATGVKGKVTDAPFIYTLEDGRLIMLWSSFDRKTGNYAIGQAFSDGDLLGPWTQSERPMNSDGGGHAMIFRDKADRLMISYHAPNKPPSHPVIRPVSIRDGRFVLDK